MNQLLTVEDLDPAFDPLALEHNRYYTGESVTRRLPFEFRNATATLPEVVSWVNGLIRSAVENPSSLGPKVDRGPSLFLLGLAGRGKTWQAFGAIRALSASGVDFRWERVTAANLFSELRPAEGGNPERTFADYRDAGLLMLDDLGAEKTSEWTIEYLCRLVDSRWEEHRPTLFTSNLKPDQFSERYGDRITSRIAGMCTRVTITGPDRRREAQ